VNRLSDRHRPQSRIADADNETPCSRSVAGTCFAVALDHDSCQSN
jgi:hypothetical protein